MIKILKSDSVKFFIVLCLFVIFVCSVLNFDRILIPFGIAYILSLMLRPIQKMFYSVTFHRKIMALLLLLSFGFALSYPIVQGVRAIVAESDKLEYYLPKLELYLRKKYSVFRTEVQEKFNYKIDSNPVDSLLEFGQESTKAIVVALPKYVASFLEWGLIVPLFLFFILKDERATRFKLLKLVPNPIVERAYYLYYQFNTKFGDYIFAKFIEATILGTIVTTGLLIMDYPFAFLLGLVAAITNILPYIGPIIGFLPALFVGLVDQNPDSSLGAMTLLYLIANIIDLALVFPVLVSKIVNLHPVVVVASVIIGSQFGGVVGMLVSIPFAAFLKLLIREIYAEAYT